MVQKISVRAVIKEKQRVLLLSPADSQLFALPGGVVEFGQQPKAVLEQSVLDSLGCEVGVSQVSDVVTYTANDTQMIVIVFLTSLAVGHRIGLRADFDKYDWVALSEIQPQMVDTETTAVLGIGMQQMSEQQRVDKNATPKEVIVYTDGGSRGNPGPSAAGFVILGQNEEVLYEGGKYLGITTNNQAEYQAVKLGLEKALEIGARVVRFRMDSQLIVNQMLGSYQVKNRDLWPIFVSIKDLVKKFETVTFTHVRREFNKEADALVNKVLDERQ